MGFHVMAHHSRLLSSCCICLNIFPGFPWQEKKDLEDLKPANKCFTLEVTCHIISAHNRLLRTNHMTLHNSQGARKCAPFVSLEGEQNWIWASSNNVSSSWRRRCFLELAPPREALGATFVSVRVSGM